MLETDKSINRGSKETMIGKEMVDFYKGGQKVGFGSLCTG